MRRDYVFSDREASGGTSGSRLLRTRIVCPRDDQHRCRCKTISLTSSPQRIRRSQLGLTFYSRCVIGVRLGEARIAPAMTGNLVAKAVAGCRAEPGELLAATRIARRPIDIWICRNECVA